jgi:TatA/E family protein of Tat protein translocase
MFDIGLPELAVILVIALLVFGPGKMVQVSRELGKGIRDFRRATSDVTKQFSDALSLDELVNAARTPVPAAEPAQSSPLETPEPPQPEVEQPAAESPVVAGAEVAQESAGVVEAAQGEPVSPPAAAGAETPSENAWEPESSPATAGAEVAPESARAVEAAQGEPVYPPVASEPPRSSIVADGPGAS